MMQMKMTQTMTIQMTMSLLFQCKLRIRLHNAWCSSIAESFTFVNMCLLISNICSAVGSQRGPNLHYSLSSVWALAGARVGPVVDQTWTQLYTLGPIRVCHLVSSCESMGPFGTNHGPHRSAAVWVHMGHLQGLYWPETHGHI